MKSRVNVAIVAALTVMLVFPVALSLAAGEGEVIHRIDKTIKEPVIKNKVNPVYPEDARKAGEQGTVVIEAVIDTAGKVKDTKILKGAQEALNTAAIEAVKQWEYEPAQRIKDGTKISVYITVTVAFRLDKDQEKK